MHNPTTGLDSESASKVDFESIRLQSGAQLQAQHLNGVNQKYSLKFIGAVKGKSLLATLPIVDGQAVHLPQDQSCIIRGFHGKYAYAFTSDVIQVRSQPFPYVHFSYPNFIESKLIRKALRVNVNLPASVIGGRGQSAVTMIDLSAKGSMINSPQAIGEISDTIKVQFDVAFEEIKTKLTLPATIRNASYSKDEGSIHFGIEFENIPQNDMLILNNFVLTTSIFREICYGMTWCDVTWCAVVARREMPRRPIVLTAKIVTAQAA